MIRYATLAAMVLIAASAPARALTMDECSAKYKAAQSAGTLKGAKWNEFRKTECSGEAAAAPADAAAAPAPAQSPADAAVVLPKAVDPKYGKEKPAKARLHTCVDQYRTNKAGNGNGGLKWIQKGGGYYSRCNAALKS
jgi:hypothetical protein